MARFSPPPRPRFCPPSTTTHRRGSVQCPPPLAVAELLDYVCIGNQRKHRRGRQTMPIRKPEIQCFPDDLLTSVLPAGNDRLWWVVHTKARQEKSIARVLLEKAVPYFVPQLEKTSLARGRKRKSLIPMFASYLFLYGNEHERYTSLATNRVAKVITVDDQEQFHSDLGQIWRLILSKAPLTPESRLATGDRVRVRGGPFAGLEGTVIERRAKCRLFVAVRLLQQGVSMEIDDFQLEPI
jgi:transcription antitermination factor NusG